MHPISALLLMLLLFGFSGCEEKKKPHDTIPVENTTQIVGETLQERGEQDRFKVSRYTKNLPTPKETTSLHDTFTLHNTKNIPYTINVSNQNVTIKENTKPITLITFFASWCPPCMHEIPYLNDLQQKYQKSLFLLGVLTHDTMDTPTLKSFLAKHAITYDVSNSTQNNDFAYLIAKTLHLSRNFPIPLTVIYVKGKYFTHYEGIVPIEMIEYDIEEALKMKMLK